MTAPIIAALLIAYVMTLVSTFRLGVYRERMRLLSLLERLNRANKEARAFVDELTQIHRPTPSKPHLHIVKTEDEAS